MQLRFKQRFFSWFDSYDIYDEYGDTYFTVKGQLAWGHDFHIYDRNGDFIGELEQQIFRFLPHFTLYENGQTVGEIVKEFSWFRPRFSMDCNGWYVEGNWVEWDYCIYDPQGAVVATISKELFNFTDTYMLDIRDERDALRVLMVVLAIDAVKCSQNS